jgi:glycosyltransferase involved in cell wall biosynthesis
MAQGPAVTVVIPTLGGATLKKTIEALNPGSLRPAEILVCIPSAERARAEHLGFDNVKVIAAQARGQVAQRAEGFRHAAHELVMQLDDDILVDARCVERLAGALIALGPAAAVGPTLIEWSTAQPVYRKPAGNSRMLDLYYWLMNGAAGYLPGTIDKSGTLLGIDPEIAVDELNEVECIAGGCVMHHRKNLVLEDFYPFAGKAYYEDVMHCSLLRRRGIKLKVHSGARCSLETAHAWHLGHGEYLKYLAADCRSRKYAMRLHSRVSARLYLFYLICYVRYLWKRVAGLKAPGKAADSR